MNILFLELAKIINNSEVNIFEQKKIEGKIYNVNHSYVENINKLIKQFKINIDDNFVKELALLENMDGFGSFSLEFITEVLDLINNKNKTFHEALEELEYYSKYLNMPAYDYLPPLEPTKADIKWLQENISYFDTKHLFY